MNQFHKIYRDEERESAHIASIGKYRKKITDLRLKMAELQTKVDLYEKYISYCIDHDSVELELLGMEHDDACIFLSEAMNIGIQANQNWVNSQSVL